MRIYWAILYFVIIFSLASCQSNGPENKSILEIANSINKELVEAREGLEALSNQASVYYARRAAYVPRPMAPYYKYYEKTVYYKDHDDGLCGMWASGYKPIGEKEREEIQFLEGLQSDIVTYANSHKVVALTHLLTTDHVGIFYPFFNGISFFEPKVNFYEAFMPFYLVTPENNPKKETIWIKPYIDAAGNGYVCSVSTPIYEEDIFKASIGADIILLQLGDEFFDANKFQMLVTLDSTLIYATPALLAEFSIKALDEFYYTKNVVIDESASSEFKLSENPSSEIKNLANIIGNNSSEKVSIGGKKYIVSAYEVPETMWRVVELVED